MAHENDAIYGALCTGTTYTFRFGIILVICHSFVHILTAASADNFHRRSVLARYKLTYPAEIPTARSIVALKVQMTK